MTLPVPMVLMALELDPCGTGWSGSGICLSGSWGGIKDGAVSSVTSCAVEGASCPMAPIRNMRTNMVATQILTEGRSMTTGFVILFIRI